MSRKVKCAVTGEIGTSDTFIKIGKHYYKNQQVYDLDRKNKEDYKKLIDYICNEFMGYGEGKPFPASLPKKLNELSYYDWETILETFQRYTNEIHNALDRMEFSGEYGKVSYMMAIVKDKIAEVQKSMLHQRKAANTTVHMECDDLSHLGTKHRGKNISKFLDDDM